MGDLQGAHGAGQTTYEFIGTKLLHSAMPINFVYYNNFGLLIRRAHKLRNL